VFAVPAGSPMEEIVTALRGQKEFNVDAFFDITYEIFGDPDFDMVSMSVPGTLTDPTNPGAALDAVRDVLGQSRAVEFRGQVTVLK
jgi:hypothetical protein